MTVSIEEVMSVCIYECVCAFVCMSVCGGGGYDSSNEIIKRKGEEKKAILWPERDSASRKRKGKKGRAEEMYLVK